MGMEKQGSKSFFQMFDWNSKSRKKLFSTKSDLPEQSKQKKICDRSHRTTQIHLLDEDRSSIKGSSDYSRASSVTDEDFSGTRAPNVVARLMGLDIMPTSNFSDSYSYSSSPFLDSQSHRDASCNPKILERSQDGHKELASFKNFMVQNQKPINRPMEKFQTEVLPPKSAKSIPITHHKLLSPIKSANFTPYRDAAYVMEAAARIIDPSPQAKGKPKLPSVGSSSSSIQLRVKNLKEKVQSSEDCSTVMKNKGKSISLALQAKANVQKREGLNSGGHKEHNAFNSSQSSKTTPKITHKKQSTSHGGSSVLQLNNQKQNCANCDRGKLQNGKEVSRESSSSVRQRTSIKASGNSKLGIRQRTSSSDTRDDKREASCSSSERIVRKKRSVDGNYHQHDQKNQKPINKSNGLIDSQSRWDDDTKSNGSDVVSFTFTTPMRDSTKETTSGKCNDISENYRTKRMLLSSDGLNKFSITGNSVSGGGDALSTLLEQKFKELTFGLDFSDNKVPPISSCSSMFQDTLRSSKVGVNTDRVISRGGSRFSLLSECGNRMENKMLLDYRLPSPVSVLDHSSGTESLNSLETAEISTRCKNPKDDGIDTNGIIGLGGLRFSFTNESSNLNSPDTASSRTLGMKQSPPNQVQEVLGRCSSWELEYVREILCNIETMFKDYALARTNKIINPRLFNQLESRKWRFNGNGLEAKIARKALFDCVSECLDMRCKQYVSGGCKSLANGLSAVTRKDKLAEELYSEISSWSCMGDSMVDEFVDKDMSGKYGRWIDFDVEAFEIGKVIEDRILSSLLDEVVDDILGL